MKQIIVAVAALIFSVSAFAKDPGVNEKVLNAFNKTFTDATEVTWSQSPTSYEVRFKQNEIQARIQYDKDGNIIQTIRYYSEEHLPLMVLSKLKNKFPSKTVFGVTELSTESGTDYYITLEDEKNWTEVKADIYGSLSVTKKIKKAN